MAYYATSYINGTAMYAPSVTHLTTNDDVNYPLDTINAWWTGSVPLKVYQIGYRIVR